MTVSTRSLSLIIISSLFFVNNAITTEATDENQKPTIGVVIVEQKQSKDEQDTEQKNNEAASVEELMLQAWVGADTAKNVLRYAAIGSAASSLELKHIFNAIINGRPEYVKGSERSYDEGTVEKVVRTGGQFVSAALIDQVLQTDMAKKYIISPADDIVGHIKNSVSGTTDKKDNDTSMCITKHLLHVVGAKLLWTCVTGPILEKVLVDVAIRMFLSSDKK